MADGRLMSQLCSSSSHTVRACPMCPLQQRNQPARCACCPTNTVRHHARQRCLGAMPASSSYSPRDWSPSLLSNYRTLLFDCDGVLWHETDVVNGAIDTLNTLAANGHRLLFVTNNSGKSRVAYESKMRSMGFGRALQADSVLSSSSAAAHYIAQQPLHVFDRSTHAVYFIGDTGIAEELQLRGIRAVSARELLGSAPVARSKLSSQPLDPSIAAVVVGIDDQLTYAKIAYAAALLSEPMAGGQQRLFVATNRDSTLPTAGRDLPGAGVCVAAVETASGRAAVNVGKPEPLMFQLASDELHLAPPEHCLMIGDRLDTDIAFGQRAGMHTMLVETGISKRADAMRADNSAHPTYIVADVSQLLAGTHSPHEQQQ